jgi:hypothetical protein
METVGLLIEIGDWRVGSRERIVGLRNAASAAAQSPIAGVSRQSSIAKSPNRQSPLPIGNLNRQSPLPIDNLNRQSPLSIDNLNRQSPLPIDNLNRQSPLSIDNLNRQSPLSIDNLNRQSPLSIGIRQSIKSAVRSRHSAMN